MMQSRAAGGHAMGAARDLRGPARHAAYAAGNADEQAARTASISPSEGITRSMCPAPCVSNFETPPFSLADKSHQSWPNIKPCMQRPANPTLPIGGSSSVAMQANASGATRLSFHIQL